MSKDAMLGFGTTITLNALDVGGGTAVGEVKSLSGPSMSVDSIEVTHFKSGDTVPYKEFIPGLADGGEIQVEANFLAAHKTLITTYGESTSATDVEVEWMQADGTTTEVKASFEAWLSGVEITSANEDVITASFTMKVTGEVTWA